MNKAAQALGRLGGKAGTGKAKSRKVTSEQARAAVKARWDKYRAEKAAASGDICGVCGRVKSHSCHP